MTCSLFELPLGDLGVMYALIYSSLERPWSTSYSRSLYFFARSYSWDVTSVNVAKSEFSQGVWVTLSANFRWMGMLPTNHCWCQKTRLIALWYDIKMSAVGSFVLSSSTCDQPTQTDKIVPPKTALALLHCAVIKHQFKILHLLKCYSSWTVLCQIFKKRTGQKDQVVLQTSASKQTYFWRHEWRLVVILDTC